MTFVSKSTSLSSAISTSGASLPIHVAPAVESIANMHCPAFKKFAGYPEILNVEKAPFFVCSAIVLRISLVLSLKSKMFPSASE